MSLILFKSINVLTSSPVTMMTPSKETTSLNLYMLIPRLRQIEHSFLFEAKHKPSRDGNGLDSNPNLEQSHLLRESLNPIRYVQSPEVGLNPAKHVESKSGAGRGFCRTCSIYILIFICIYLIPDSIWSNQSSSFHPPPSLFSYHYSTSLFNYIFFQELR